MIKEYREQIVAMEEAMERDRISERGEKIAENMMQMAEGIGQDLKEQYQREVIKSICSRVKSAESICAKLLRKGYPCDWETAKGKLADLIGVRIVCMFLDDVYEVATILENLPNIKVLKTKDYIKKPKKNGYMSYHMIVEVLREEPTEDENAQAEPGEGKQATKGDRVEIQIRTAAMDFWSVLDYQLFYKKDYPEAKAVGKELRKYSAEVAELDRKFLKLRNEIEKL